MNTTAAGERFLSMLSPVGPPTQQWLRLPGRRMAGGQWIEYRSGGVTERVW